MPRSFYQGTICFIIGIFFTTTVNKYERVNTAKVVTGTKYSGFPEREFSTNPRFPLSNSIRKIGWTRYMPKLADDIEYTHGVILCNDIVWHDSIRCLRITNNAADIKITFGEA